MHIPSIKTYLTLTCLLLIGTLSFSGPGCSSLNLPRFPWQAKEEPEEIPIGGKTKLVGDFTLADGHKGIPVEGIGLVVNLNGTGSTPPLTGQRAILLDDMRRRSVDKPEKVLESTSTAMVMIRGVIPPGAQIGDKFDIEVRCMDGDDTTSLRGGWLLEARLTIMGVLADGQLHKSGLVGVAQGPVLIDPVANIKNNHVLACRGRILSGGTARQDRTMGLILKEGKQHPAYAAQVAKAINRRFFISRNGGYQDVVAVAKNDKLIELQVHPRYKDNVPRYFQVVRSIAVRESTIGREKRIALLKEQLLDPAKSRAAALQLEAIGKLGIDALKVGLTSENPEVRFRSAEALAYLGQQQAIPVLGKAAATEPAFRVFALAALGVMKEDYEAADELKKLLDVPSVETRYGAFRMLTEMHRIPTEYLGEQFHYCVLPSSHDAMVHVTNSHRPEIVLFGTDQKILTPCLLEAGPRIHINSQGGDEISISRFGGGQLDQKRIVKNRLDDVIRAIVELDGTYPDVVQMLQDAKANNLLLSRFEVDALPEAGRTYYRTADKVEPYEVKEKPAWWKKFVPGSNKQEEKQEDKKLDTASQNTTPSNTEKEKLASVGD